MNNGTFKSDNSHKMDTFLERHKLSKLTREIENLNSLVSIKETNFVIKNLPRKKTPGLVSFTCESHQLFKEKLISILYKPFQKREEKALSKSFYQVSITLIPKINKNFIRKLKTNIPHGHRCKINFLSF